jgi:dephospho-CoA kinase
MTSSSQIVVGVAGRIGSGKTAVSRFVEMEFGFQYLRYSQVLADWFHADPADKVLLQSVGGQVMTGAGQHELNRRLIAKIDRLRDAVVDGLRHPVDYESLRDAFGERFFLVYVDTPAAIRFERLIARFQTYEEFREADNRAVEGHIDSLKPLASVVLSGAAASEQLASAIRTFVFDFREGMVA